jgi:hypothetical protein
MVRDAIAMTRSKNLLDAPGWEPYFSKWALGLNEFVDWYVQTHGEKPDPIGLLTTSPAKGAAFWELDTLRLSTPMKMAVWRILLGCEIVSIRMNLEPRAFELVVLLRAPNGEYDPRYETQDSENIRFLRHLGTIEADGRTQFQGYYAFA